MATILEKLDDATIKRTKAEEIVFAIIDEMSGRRGVLDINSFDEDIQEEMLQAWVDITNKKLK